MGHTVLSGPERKKIGQQAQVKTYLSHKLTPTIVFVLCSSERARERESYVLILRSFQEKYIPERCFHVCHIMEEKFSP